MTTKTYPYLPFTDAKPNALVDLFCLHYAGGSAAIFRHWDGLFPSWVSVRPIELPGRGARITESLEDSPSELVQQLCQQLSPHLNRPWALFGHSLGAALGYQIAVHFEQQQNGPLAFFPSGRHAPVNRDPAPKRSHLSDTELLEAIRELNGSPPEVLDNPELMALMLPIIRADFILSEAFREQSQADLLHCPIGVFGSTADPEVPHQQLTDWQQVAGSDFSLAVLDGDHFFLQQEDQFQQIRLRIVGKLTELLNDQRICQIGACFA